MDWPALAIVFTVSSLMMILERFVNHRQSDGRSASHCCAFDDTPAAVRRSSHIQARSRKKPRPQAIMTTSGGCCNFNSEHQQQQQDDLCFDYDDCDYTRPLHHQPRQSGVTENQSSVGVTYRNSDTSIYCCGAPTDENGNRRGANSSSGNSPCGGGSPAESITGDPQWCEMQPSVKASGTGRRYCMDAVEIVTEFNDTEADLGGEPIEDDCCEPHGSQWSSSRRWKRCRRSMFELSMAIDYVVRVLGVLLLMLLVLSWFARLVERRKKGGDDEETWRAWLKDHSFFGSIFSSIFGCEEK